MECYAQIKNSFTCILITHDLREAVYLADQVIVLSNRPATIQNSISTKYSDKKKISDLYTPKVAKILFKLRQQIEIAQSKK